MVWPHSGFRPIRMRYRCLLDLPQAHRYSPSVHSAQKLARSPMSTDLITELKPTKSAPPLLVFRLRPARPWSCRSDANPGHVGTTDFVCRDRQGRVAAMRDICPHRGMPLSFGHFDGERVECAYHGWQFDTGGRCRHIPARSRDRRFDPRKSGSPPTRAKRQTQYVGLSTRSATAGWADA